MTKRELHLEHIRIEVAREGRVTQEAIRHYIENRISRQAFQEAIDKGMRQYEARTRRDAVGQVQGSSHPPSAG
jgi:hypothetical protein